MITDAQQEVFVYLEDLMCHECGEHWGCLKCQDLSRVLEAVRAHLFSSQEYEGISIRKQRDNRLAAIMTHMAESQGQEQNRLSELERISDALVDDVMKQINRDLQVGGTRPNKRRGSHGYQEWLREQVEQEKTRRNK